METAILQGPEESPHLFRGGKKASGWIVTKVQSWDAAPFPCKGFGGNDRVKAEPHLLAVGLESYIKGCQPILEGREIMPGNDRAEPHANPALESCYQKIPGSFPAIVAKKVMDFPGTVQAQFKKESLMLEESIGKAMEGDGAAGDDFHRFSVIQAGRKDIWKIRSDERLPALQADEIDRSKAGEGGHDSLPLSRREFLPGFFFDAAVPAMERASGRQGDIQR